ncbi:hypothetical protein Tco_1390707, partial [Tanacetum coccineum]
EKDDVDEWLNAEITKHMSMQGVENMKDGLISTIKSIGQEMKDGIMKRQVKASIACVSDELSSIASNKVDKADDNTSNTAPYRLPKELSPGSFLLPFNIDNHSFYVITTLDAKDNIMPLKVYKYLGLDQFRGTSTEENNIGTDEPLGTIDIMVCYGQQKIDDTTREQRYYEWVAQNYEFSKHKTLTSTNLNDHYPYNTNDPIPTPQGHHEQGDDEPRPIGLCPCNYSFEEWLKIRTGHNNLHESDREFIFNEWILDSYDVEEEYAWEIGNPYSIRFDEYKRMFNNEIKHLSNEYILRIGKKWYVLDDVWEKFQQNYKKKNEAWHDEGYEEDEMCFICITDREDGALPVGRVNGARFKAMIRKELKDNKIQKLGGNYQDRLDS